MKLFNLLKLYLALFFICGAVAFAGCSLFRDDTVEITGVDSDGTEGDVTDTGSTEANQKVGASDNRNNSDEEISTDSSAMISVYVCGAVMYPDVYELVSGSRAVDALEAAGGFADTADTDAVNLARQIYDGEQLYIPYEGEAYIPDTVSESSESLFDSLVNINTADLEELKTLSGIGDAKAAAIIEYREQHGNFNSIDEIMNVNGIGDALYQKIKDYITV